MTANLARVEIRDEASLLQACDLLHDAWLAMETLHFEKEAGTWECLFRRDFFEDEGLLQRQKVLLIFTRTSWPLAKSQLSLTKVAECGVRDQANLSTYTFNECQPLGDGRYRLLFCESMEMILRFEGAPRGCLQDLEILDERRSLIHLGRFPLLGT